jgi:hypothetical protein
MLRTSAEVDQQRMIANRSGGLVGSDVLIKDVATGVFSENDDIHHKIVLLKGDLQQQMIDFSSEPGYSKVDFCNTGGGLAPILDTSVEKSNGDATVKVASVARGDVPTQDIHQLMGVASSQMSGGKSLGTSWSPPLVAKSNVRLSLVENSSNSMTARRGGDCLRRYP